MARFMNRRVISAALVGIMLAATVPALPCANRISSVYADDELSEAEEKKKDASSKKDEAERKLNTLKAEKQDLLKTIEDLDMEISGYEEKISLLTEERNQLQAKASITESNLQLAYVAEATQYANMKERIQFAYENGDAAYIEALLAIKDYSTAVNQSEYVSQVSTYDQNQLNDLLQIEQSINTLEEEIYADLSDIEDLKDAAVEEQEALKVMQDGKQETLSEYNEEISATEYTIEQLEAIEIEQDNVIAGLEAAAAQRRAAAAAATQTQTTTQNDESQQTADLAATQAAADAAAQKSAEEAAAKKAAEEEAAKKAAEEEAAKKAAEEEAAKKAAEQAAAQTSDSTASPTDASSTSDTSYSDTSSDTSYSDTSYTNTSSSSTTDTSSDTSYTDTSSTSDTSYTDTSSSTSTDTSSTSTSNTSTSTSTSTYTMATYNGGGFTWPMPSSSTITSPFGMREIDVEGATSNHRGIDISCPSGSSVVAAADGVVAYVGYFGTAGNAVLIDHGNGITTMYYHLSSFNTTEGANVYAGQTIAYSGSTGASSGPHLHFGVRINGSYVDPLSCF